MTVQGIRHIQGKKLRSAGFTFIETLVAISVLLLAVVAPLTLGSQGITASRISRDQVTASLLAQEAIEYVRSVRDSNELAGNSWLEDLDECIDAPCSLSVPTNNLTACDDKDTCPLLSYDEDIGIYFVSGEKGVTQTKFVRRLTIETINASEVRVESLVAWEDGTIARSVMLEDYLYDW